MESSRFRTQRNLSRYRQTQTHTDTRADKKQARENRGERRVRKRAGFERVVGHREQARVFFSPASLLLFLLRCRIPLIHSNGKLTKRRLWLAKWSLSANVPECVPFVVECNDDMMGEQGASKGGQVHTRIFKVRLPAKH